MNDHPAIAKIALPALAFLSLMPIIDPVLALVMGVGCTLMLGNPFQLTCEKLPKKLLPLSVIGLGGGMNLIAVLEAGASGFVYTAISITLTIALGLVLARALKVERGSSLLITVGTAICGGSAIAAVAPAIQARSAVIAVSLAVVFILNASALLLFPLIGHMLEMSQHSFGLWTALAIHDTSSVVGEGLKYGEEALQTGTSLKLARALWIVPLVFAIGALYQVPDQEGASRPKHKYPWFILGFLAMAAIVTYVPAVQHVGEWIAFAARRVLVLTLFLIGTNIHADILRTIGAKPFILGILLWGIISAASLAAIQLGLII